MFRKTKAGTCPWLENRMACIRRRCQGVRQGDCMNERPAWPIRTAHMEMRPTDRRAGICPLVAFWRPFGLRHPFQRGSPPWASCPNRAVCLFSCNRPATNRTSARRGLRRTHRRWETCPPSVPGMRGRPMPWPWHMGVRGLSMMASPHCAMPSRGEPMPRPSSPMPGDVCRLGCDIAAKREPTPQQRCAIAPEESEGTAVLASGQE
jgi:hypothetical protein